MDGNSGAPQNSGFSAEAQTFIESGTFAEQLDYEQISNHLMNNSAVQDAAEDLAESMAETFSWVEEHEQYRQLLADIYGNADLTVEDLANIPEGDGGIMGPNRRHATSLMQTRDRMMNDFTNVNQRALDDYDSEVDAELRIVQSTFRDLATQLNGPNPDAVGRRRRIAEVDAAMEAIRAQLAQLQSQLSRLRMGAMNLEHGEIVQGLSDAASDFDEWVRGNSNPMIRRWYTAGGPMRSVANQLSSTPRTFGTPAAVAAMEARAEQMVDSYVHSLPNQYPEVYQEYNSLMGGHHLRTWAETWWEIASVAAWIIGAEVIGRVASIALAPFTSGASVVLINAAIHVQRTKFLGGIITRIAASPSASAVIRAGGRTLAAARWLVELHDRAIDYIVSIFDKVARRVLGLAPRVRPTPAAGATVTGTGTVATYTCCTLTSR